MWTTSFPQAIHKQFRTRLAIRYHLISKIRTANAHERRVDDNAEGS
jgi:hypothetical protein